MNRLGNEEDGVERHYFYVPDLKLGEKEVILLGEEFYHLDRVLRLKKSNSVYLLNGKGYIVKADILTKTRNSARLNVIDASFVPELGVKIILMQAIIKKNRMELLLEKATELGVFEIIPVITENCIIKEEEFKKSKFNRWEKIIIQALKQSANPWLPELKIPVLFEEMLEKYSQDKFPKFILAKDGQDISTLSRLSLDRGKVGILVGPEGDFTKNELAQAVASGFTPLSLGKLRLRSETAAIVAVSILKYQESNTKS